MLIKSLRFYLWVSLAITLLVVFTPGKMSSQDVPDTVGCEVCGMVFTGPRLASLNTSQGALSNAIFSTLLGSTINLSVADWNALASTDISLLNFLNAFLDFSDPEDVLTSDVEIGDIAGAIVVASNDGTLANILDDVLVSIDTASVRLDNILQLNTIDDYLAEGSVNVYNLVTAVVQLYNYNNVLLTPMPMNVTVPGVTTASLQACVIEPPHFGCGQTGTSFYSPAMRLKISLNVSEALTVINLPGLSADANLLDFDIYLHLARGQLDITQVNSPLDLISQDVQPGLVDVFIGSTDDLVFFDRTQNISSSNFTHMIIGQINVSVGFPPFAISDNIDIEFLTWGSASSATDSLSMNAPGDCNTISSSSTVVVNLLNGLAFTNMDIQLSSGIIPLATLSQVLSGLTSTLGTFLLDPGSIIYYVFDIWLDGLLELLGIGIGEMDICRDVINQDCDPLLPLDLISFTGESSFDKASLKWETSNEILVKGFEIHRSESGLDFEYIGWVDSKGIEGGSWTYEFDDVLFRDGLYYYRIKIIDQDGSYEYSPIIAINHKFGQEEALSICPNPVKDNLIIEYSSSINGMVKELMVINQIGEVIIRTTLENNNTNKFELDCSTLPANAIYQLVILEPEKMHMKQFAKVE